MTEKKNIQAPLFEASRESHECFRGSTAGGRRTQCCHSVNPENQRVNPGRIVRAVNPWKICKAYNLTSSRATELNAQALSPRRPGLGTTMLVEALKVDHSVFRSLPWAEVVFFQGKDPRMGDSLRDGKAPWGHTMVMTHSE